MYNINSETNTIGLDELVQFKIASGSRSKAKAIVTLKNGIWVYFWLLLFEGALRKWVLPGLATPLLVVRDPVAIWIIAYSYMQGMFKSNVYVSSTWVVGLISLFTTLLIGHGNIGIALYGLRILILHFPLLFIIGQVFDKADVIKVGKALLWSTIAMTFIIAIQFYSPQTAWINTGVGGTGSSGFNGSMGFFRPSGIFSFTSGLANFYGLAGTFICFFWVDGTKGVQKWLLTTATVGLIIAIPLSISRTVFFQLGLTVAFTFFLASQKPKLVSRILLAVVGAAIIFILLGKTSFFSTGAEAFNSRFEEANQVGGGIQSTLIDRILGGMVEAVVSSDNLPFFGYGLGLGTNAGAALLTGKAVFLFSSEGEWGRLIGEMGILLGMAFVLVRTGVCYTFLTTSFRDVKRGNFLPWLISSFAFLSVLQGQWGQPNSLGFAVFSGGLLFAALIKAKVSNR